MTNATEPTLPPLTPSEREKLAFATCVLVDAMGISEEDAARIVLASAGMAPDEYSNDGYLQAYHGWLQCTVDGAERLAAAERMAAR